MIEDNQVGAEVATDKIKVRKIDAEKFEASPTCSEKFHIGLIDHLQRREDMFQMIERMLNSRNVLHILFKGPPGAGKTSTIKAFVEKIYKQRLKSMTLSLSAVDMRSREELEQTIQTFVGQRQLFPGATALPKLVILDGIDAMPDDLQVGLLSVMDAYNKNACFVLIGGDTAEIKPGIMSRCVTIHFKPLSPDQILGRLRNVASEENVELTDDGAEAIVDIGGMDMAKTLNAFHMAATNNKVVNAQVVHGSTALPLDRQGVDRFVKTTMMSPSVSLSAGVQELKQFLQGKFCTLPDVIVLMFQCVASMDLSLPQRQQIVTALADINLSVHEGASDRFIIPSIVGAFHSMRVAN